MSEIYNYAEIRTYDSYVKEVAGTIDAISENERYEYKTAERIGLLLYETLTEDLLEYIDSDRRTEEGVKEALENLSLTELRGVINERAQLVGLDWRTVKYDTGRVKLCAVCGEYFYDVSRNGKTVACNLGGVYRRMNLSTGEPIYRVKNDDKLSYCQAIYERFREGETVRRVNEELIDFNYTPTEEGDVQFIRLMEVEKTASNQSNVRGSTPSERRAQKVASFRI